MRRSIRWFTSFMFTVWAAGSASAAIPGDVPAGQVVAQVPCASDPTFSYAAYVPASYDPARSWPILLCFDPLAKGLIPVKLFHGAAEEHGYIVVGSNNSRNGPPAPNVAAAEAMLTDARRRWNVDRERTYAAGFSGAARTAARLGLGGVVSGVIGCGGAFPDTAIPPVVGFDFFGAAGSRDFNREEMESVDRALRVRGVAHRLEIFQGEHEWMPAALGTAALAWLDAQHRHAGLRRRWRAFLERNLDNGRRAPLSLPPPEAWLECRRLLLDHPPLIDVSGLEAQERELRRLSEVRAARGKLRTVEREYRERLLAALALARSGDVAGLQALAAPAASDGGSADPELNRRVRQGVLPQILGHALARVAAGDHAGAIIWIRAATILVPGHPALLYDRACVEALAGAEEAAFSSLQLAIDAGFHDRDQLRREPAFDETFREHPAFRDLLEE